ncbi:heavy metal-binding domain-containing protein [Nodosilinea sp. LEGE 06152]|uniref:YbjQ family protein n=1 Tax=Nodosilinea sp. LEGE 06152 TaxID=2777966 RepID=UPI001882BCFE|nr:heavy metal-binding domain-containing protein [Nodosilinea sp. LEGE 06152]MBE9155819.1 heavy metal-binding domain-containing protein [Nodosilinea sp. LEGE 06152]
MEEIVVFAILLGIGYFFGARAEKQHLRLLQHREQAIKGLVLSTAGAKATVPDARQAELFVGSVVISSDFFKTFIAGLLKLFGGRITVYESLLERGRREALLRMEESALAWGAERVVNIRIQTAELSGNNGRGVVALEVMAYGTGVR